MIPLSTIPPNPGVYQFKDSAWTIIYIGKAKNLHKRVSSYFNSVEKDAKTMLLVRHIETVDFIIVDSEVEALLLENKLIKAHTPKYNINLKDGKTFAYIGLSVEKFPRIFSTRSVSKRVQLFGPYTDGYARRQLIDLSVRLFKLRVCFFGGGVFSRGKKGGFFFFFFFFLRAPFKNKNKKNKPPSFGQRST